MSTENRAVIAGYARSPFHFAQKGGLARVRPDDLAAAVIRGLVERSGVDTALVEDFIVGCAFPEGEQGMNIARLIGLLAGLPPITKIRSAWVRSSSSMVEVDLPIVVARPSLVA